MSIFISYSRANSDFALKVAQDLKSAGYTAWLDQLDIPKGARWDDEIEKALKGCTVFIILLSPDSSKSQNVKDEIGYAINEEKHILPLLIEECEIPFRLQRFQYVSYIDKPYDEGLVELKGLLALAGEDAGDSPMPNKRQKVVTPPNPIPNPNRSSKNTVMVIVGVSLLALAWAGYRFLSNPTTTPTETEIPRAITTEPPSAVTDEPIQVSTEIPPTESVPIKIAYVMGSLGGQNGAIYIANENGSSSNVVTDKDCLNSKPSWASDGKSLIYQSNCHGSYDILQVNASGGGKQILIGDPSYDEVEADFSPNGKAIAYVRYAKGNAGNSNGDIRIFEMGGNDYSTDVEGRGPVFSPDGNSILYMYFDGARWAISIYNTTTKSNQQVTTFLDKDARWPAWSPDGKYVAFNSATGGGNTLTGIWKISNNGEGATSLISGNYGRPNWSENGWIIFNSPDGLWEVKYDGSDAHPLTTDGGWAGVWSR